MHSLRQRWVGGREWVIPQVHRWSYSLTCPPKQQNSERLVIFHRCTLLTMTLSLSYMTSLSSCLVQDFICHSWGTVAIYSCAVITPDASHTRTRCNQKQLVNSEFTPNTSDIDTALAVLAPTRLIWHQEQAGIIPNSCTNNAAAPPGGGDHRDEHGVWESSTWQVNQPEVRNITPVCKSTEKSGLALFAHRFCQQMVSRRFLTCLSFRLSV